MNYTQQRIDQYIDRSGGVRWESPYQPEGTRNAIKQWAREFGTEEAMPKYGDFRAVVKKDGATYVVEIVVGGEVSIYRERATPQQPSEALLDFLFGGASIETLIGQAA